MTGVGLGLTSSVKWVGLFTIATIGFSTIKGLWDLLGNLRVSPTQWTKHFMARALGLIIVPIALYMFFFSIHFLILSNSGDGDGFMSTEFRQTLNGNYRTKDTPIDVAYDSMITIKHVNTAGGYLHSHRHNYPEGSKQQQVTLYPHRDGNNDWLIQNITELEIPLNETDPIWVKDGSIIRLYHLKTHRRLHSHDIRPPLTDAKYQNEVSTYGYEGFSGDGNDDWRVEIADYDKSDSESGKRLRALHTKFRLRHVVTGCYLFSHSVKLPDWGFNQQEVTCVNGGSKPNTIWYIESNSHPKLPEDAEKVNYKKIGFFGKFFEINKVMWTTNSGLTGSHPYESRPSSWVLLDRGISFWGKDHRHIYLIGNPIVWWSSSLALYFYIVVETVIILRAKRGYSDHLNPLKEFYESYASFFFLGWFLHYFPFFLMARQLFLHHYFPALYFAVLLVGVGFDFLTIRLKPKNRIIVASVFIIISIYAFSQLSPLAYAEPWTKNDCLKVKKWGSRWDFDCNQFHDSYDQYYTKDLTVINNINNQTNIDISSSEISHTLSSDQQQKQENDNKESLQEIKDDVGEVGKSIDLVENDNKENLQEIKNDTDGVDEAIDLADVIDNENIIS
nr:5957_t:CDS:2 [Entrophospora candida]